MQNDTYTPKTFTTTEKMERIVAALADLGDQGTDLRAQIAALDKAGICTGRIYWRRENGNPPKLYVNHGAKQPCPIHGEPRANGRLRSYVGLDPDRQAQAEAAIERYKEKDALQDQISRVEVQISRIERAISNAYYAASNQQRWEL